MLLVPGCSRATLPLLLAATITVAAPAGVPQAALSSLLPPPQQPRVAPSIARRDSSPPDAAPPPCPAQARVLLLLLARRLAATASVASLADLPVALFMAALLLLLVARALAASVAGAPSSASLAKGRRIRWWWHTALLRPGATNSCDRANNSVSTMTIVGRVGKRRRAILRNG